MKPRLSLQRWAVSIALALLVTGSAYAQIDLGQTVISGSIEAGAYPQPVPDTSIAKFREYRDLAQQIWVPELQLFLGGKEQEYYANFDMINVAQEDEMYNLRLGRYGLLDIQAQWFEIPHFFSDDVARSPYIRNGSTYTLLSRPGPGADPTGAKFGTWLNQNARPIDLSMLEGVANLNIRYTPTPEWTLSASYNFQNPTGNRAFSTLFGSPGSFNINELFEPIDYRIHNYEVGAEYARHGWSLAFKYQGSFFNNPYTTLTWDNPDTWGEMTGPNGTCVDSATYNRSAGTGPCRGRANLFPSNQAHNFVATATGTLPFSTHVMANLSYGIWLQDAPFLPFTINSALPQVALPRQSLHGDVQPLFANLTVVSNPIERLRLKATYTYYDYHNATPAMRFSTLPALNDVSSSGTDSSYPFAFSIQDINLQLTYNLSEQLAASFVYDLHTYHNKGINVPQQDQSTYGPVLDWTPKEWLEFRSSYQYSWRDSPSYYDAGSYSGLRRFDQASLKVHQFNIHAQVMPRKDLTFYAEANYDDYDYPASDAGRQHFSSYSPSVGVNYNPIERVNFFADYSWMAYDWNLESIQRANSGAGGCPATAAAQTIQNCPGRTWFSSGRNQGSSMNVGFDILIPKNWLLVNASRFRFQYTYSVGTDTIHAYGDTIGLPPTGATNYPNVGSQFHELMVRYQYQLRKNMAINVGYIYNHFGENDFGVDNMTPWMGSLAPYSGFLGDSIKTPYNANVGFASFTLGF